METSRTNPPSPLSVRATRTRQKIAWRTALAALFAALVCMAPANALSASETAGDSQVGGKTVRVGVFDLPPFVMADGQGGRHGYALELWQEVAGRLGVRCEYTVYDTIGNLFSAVREGEEDVVVTALTITTERAKWCRFSFPWYESGMTIMVRDDDQGIWHQLRQNRYIRFYALFILVLCILSFLITLVRRKKEADFPEDWKHGFYLSLFNLVVLIRQGRLHKDFHTWKGNLLSVFWTLFGVAAVAYVTSTLTAAMMAVAQDTGAIASVADLGDRKVGALEGGLAIRYLEQLQLAAVPSKNIEAAAESLRSGRIDAFVGDFPVLNYWTNTNREKNLKIVGKPFHPEKFAFAVNRGDSELAEQITVQLIHLHDDGTTEKLAAKYYLDYRGTNPGL